MLTRPLAVILAVTALTGGAVALAAEGPVDFDSPPAGADNDLTPNAHKDPPGWVYSHGVKFGEESAPPESITAFADDLFTVGFANANTKLGLAGGATCAEPGLTGAAATSCSTRVPVLYEYSSKRPLPPSWHKVDLPGADRPGYIGAVAWYGNGRALAVGGDGRYPRREPAYSADDPTGAENDEAGQARVWERRNGTWTELSDLPSGMRGLTALAFDTDTDRPAFGFAGGLGQIWKWEGDGFTDMYDSSSPDSEMVAAEGFRYRVRQIRHIPVPGRIFFAVTAGCCGPTVADNAPRLMRYSGKTGLWDADMLRPGAPVVPPGASGRPNERVDMPDSFYSFVAAPPNFDGKTMSLAVVASPGGPPAETEPPSFISQPYCTSTEESSGQLFALPGDQAFELLRRNAGSARLVAGDGDTSRTTASAFHLTFNDPAPYGTPGSPSTITQNQDLCGQLDVPGHHYPGDGVPDWAVGELRSTHRDGLGAQGLLVATGERSDLRPGVIDTNPDQNHLADWEPTSQTRITSYVPSQYYLAPTFTLNAIEMVASTGQGWAVGDHGAIVRRGGAAASRGGDKPPPALSSAEATASPDTSAYDPFRPLGAPAPGPVPSLVEQPIERLREGRLEPSGSPDPQAHPQYEPVRDVNQVVMSRDGGEGWAIGPSDKVAGQTGSVPSRNGSMALYHFIGGQWSMCRMSGIAGVIPPDPACAELVDRLSFTDTDQQEQSAKLTLAARIPLERDDDPGNDDEFEVIATGTDVPMPDGSRAALMLRYRDGHWTEEAFEVRTALNASASHKRIIGLAYASPADGWAVQFNGGNATALISHWDGSSWSKYCPGSPGCEIGGPLDLQPEQVVGVLAAGRRVYIYGNRVDAGGASYPFMVYRDPGGSWRSDDGGYDPMRGGAAASERGELFSLGVAQRADGSYEGWAFGRFGTTTTAVKGNALVPVITRTVTSTMRLASGSTHWERYDDSGPLRDYMLGSSLSRDDTTGHSHWKAKDLSARPTTQVQLPGSGDRSGRAFVGQTPTGRLLTFDPQRERWELVPGARPPAFGEAGGLDGMIQAVAPDGQGGAWIALRNFIDWKLEPANDSHTYFFRYTDHPRRQVYEEVPNPAGPAGRKLTALAGAPDGSAWLATSSSALYHYDRLTGWDRVSIPGWDPGRVVTRASAVRALAVNDAGVGLAVGEGGRIARLDGRGVALDAVSGTLCVRGAPEPPCGTGEDLTAAGIAADGSALAGGDRMSLLYRPGQGQFAAVAGPEDAPVGDRVTGVSMPAAGITFITTSSGLLYEGHATGAAWSWELADLTPDGDLLASGERGEEIALRAIAVDTSGGGYAVGDAGVILRRDPRQGTWRRLNTGYRDSFTAVTLAPGRGDKAVIGGRNGIVLTVSGDEVAVSRPADYFGGSGYYSMTYGQLTGPVVGISITPGAADGQTESWVTIQGREGTGVARGNPDNGVDRLLHYASDPGEPLLSPGGRAAPLPDAPDPREAEVSIATFGESSCAPPEQQACPGMGGSTGIEEVISQRVVSELRERAARPGGPDLAVFTGDAINDQGESFGSAEEQIDGPGNSLFDAPLRLRRWREFVVSPLEEGGLPLFAAIGGGDLGAQDGCPATFGSNLNYEGAHNCSPRPHLRTGENLTWRSAMASMRAPWGSGPANGGSLEFQPAPGQSPVAADTPAPAGDVTVPTGGARTHYALDILRSGKSVARLVVVDTSLKSLKEGDPVQQPREDSGGQQAWLERMLCEEGEREGCSRKPGLPVIVASNTPTYSYGPGGLTDTHNLDATSFEQTLLDERASAVLSGRLGWNGRYWATAAGLHSPCAGDSYADEPPEDGIRTCASADSADVSKATEALQGALTGLGAPAAPTGSDVTGTGAGLLPFAVASSAGGRLADKNGTAADGYWHGYSIVRVAGDGDPAKTIVEQRPVFDWLTVSGNTHVLRPGQKMALRGIGREPIGVDTTLHAGATPVAQTTRYDVINSPAITHRYDLIEADAAKPWLPKIVEGNGNPHGYVPIDPSVATVDAQSGKVATGRSSHPRIYALALLSVGDKAATYPLVFEPKKSYVAKLPKVISAAAIPPIRVLGLSAASLQPPAQAPPSSPPPPPVGVSLQLPTPPMPPSFPTVSTPPISPPAPPAPPPPPASQSTPPLNLSISLTGIMVPPTTGVSAQPTPPVNPAPPGGARKEARQKQAATAKSAEGSSDTQQATGDLAQSPPGPRDAGYTRHDLAFTRRSAHAQPSAWTTGLQWGGGMTLMALALALGWTGVRPTPRGKRRDDVRPAPAWNPTRRR